MKSLFVFAFLISFSCHSQIIDSITYSPQNPGAGDTVNIYCYVQYPNQGCQLVEQDYYFGPGAVFLRAFHCMGILTVLCPTIDTFKVSIDYPGTYEFYYMPGFIADSINCTFPILQNGDTIPYPFAIESISITFSDSTASVNQIQNSKEKNWKFYPNPASNKLTIIQEAQEDSKIEILSASGRLIKVFQTNKIIEEMDISSIPSGLFFIHFSNSKLNQIERLIIK